ncbi:hypothetical protein [Sphingomonas faeni]|uniref:hypothetical protein n=1 Tax=Sphingomonas faeni TaxID=185950 RepID=UPI003357DBC6
MTMRRDANDDVNSPNLRTGVTRRNLLGSAIVAGGAAALPIAHADAATPSGRSTSC